MLKEWIQKEISLKRKSGTYFFYGEDTSRLERVVKDFAKALCCRQSDDFFCDSCDTCHRIEKGIYSDLHILESLKIEEIRSMENILFESAYEGDSKIFILPNVQDLKKESANALLKSIEEPGEGSFFLLWGTHKNILATIRSRAISVFVPRFRYSELGVSRECYEFFQGNAEDILAVRDKNIVWEERKNYKKIRQYLNAYKENKSLEDKIAIYQALIDFYHSKEYLSIEEKMYFAEEVCMSSYEREDLAELFRYYLRLSKREDGLEERLQLSKMLNFPINMKIFFVNLFLK